MSALPFLICPANVSTDGVLCSIISVDGGFDLVG